jgi:AraC-like DNA-binding protein
MKIETYYPSAQLRPFIDAFMIIESEHGMQNRILPDTSIIMAFCFKGKITSSNGGPAETLPKSVITGLKKSFRLITYSENSATLLVKFKELGASAFFDLPVYEFCDTTVPLDNLLNERDRIEEMSGRLGETENNRLRVSMVENFLLNLYRGYRPDYLVNQAILQIGAAKGNIRVNQLLENLPISQDPFEKRFRRITGASPKHFAEIVRLRNVIRNRQQTSNLTDAALSSGYYDQAHFIKNFKTFTGQQPRLFFQNARYW